MVTEDGEIVADDVKLNFKPFVRSRYNYSMEHASEQTGLFCPEPTMAQQQFAEECDINTIVERFGLTGQLPQNLRMPINEEFVETMDYQSALNKLMEAESAFMELPASVRTEFQNDAGKFVDFVSNPENVERCRELGLAVPKKEAAVPLEVRVVPEPAPSGPGTGSA